MLPNYLCIGHVCMDKTDKGYVLGGSASYSGICAQLLGKEVGIITSFGGDFQFLSDLKKTTLYQIHSEHTTVFENIYHGENRTQYLHQTANRIYAKDIPVEWLDVPLVHIAPIADEVDFEVLKAFSKDTLIACTPQGWMRRWDEKTRQVSPKTMDWSKLSGIDILILSDEDIRGYEHLLPEIIRNIPIVVLTRGHSSATVFHKGKEMNFPVFPTQVVDPTGAGDTFATGFLVKYLETKDLSQSVAYGHVVASFCIEAKGLSGLKTKEEVEERFEEYKKLFSRRRKAFVP